MVHELIYDCIKTQGKTEAQIESLYRQLVKLRRVNGSLAFLLMTMTVYISIAEIEKLIGKSKRTKGE